ncbi:MAG TPA: ATP/GTP-binding protein [Chitinophagaceae bacterium]|nr:ATP/GTP-binding protein [Chitinophagaceae bacterium]
MQKIIGVIIIVFFFISCSNKKSYNIADAKHKLIKKWETDTVLKIPESVLFDGANHILYTSNVDGEGWTNDGVGSIGKVGLDGKIINSEWVTGLSAPKGMGLYNGKLYVADLTNMLIIDTSTGEIVKKMPIPGADCLNDLVLDKNGVAYISDSKNKKVFRVENENVQVYLENLKAPNGVLIFMDSLLVLDNDNLVKVGSDRAINKFAEGLEGGTDGVENINGKDFLVSGWNGTLWYVYSDGTKELLLDTRKEEKNAADIGFDPATNTVYVPTYNKKSVVAYEVK